MRKAFIFILALLTISVISCQKDEIIPVENLNQDQSLVKNGDIIPGKYIVVLKTDATKSLPSNYDEGIALAKEEAKKVFSKVGFSTEKIDKFFGNSIVGFTAELSELELNSIYKDEKVKLIEPDRWIVLDYKITGKPVKTDAKQTVPWGITRIGGATNYTGSNVAWIIDTGIDLDHPDLNVNTSLSKTFVPRSKSADDDNGHGTHVAGTVAALDNNIGVVGVAAGAPVVAVKVLDRRGSGAYSTIIQGVDYVASVAKAGDVANMSLGGPVYPALDEAIINASNKGIKFALAAGNESTDANLSSPAHINGNNIFTISAMDSNDNFASFSNYGNPPIDYCAPGVNIYSTYKSGNYATLSGTSMASPHACGVLLLGTPKTDGYVKNDPDGNPDPIIHR